MRTPTWHKTQHKRLQLCSVPLAGVFPPLGKQKVSSVCCAGGMTSRPLNSQRAEKGTELHGPKAWLETWSLSFPVLGPQGCIFVFLVPCPKTLTLACPTCGSPCCRKLPVYFTGCWCHLGKMRQASHSPSIKENQTGYKTKAFLSLRECLQMRWMPECVRACQLENKSSTWTSAQKADSPARHLLSSEETPSLALQGHKVLSGGRWEPDFSTSFSPPACRADKSCGLAAQAGAQRDLQRFDTAQTFPRHQPTYSSPRVKKNSTEIKNHKCNCLNSHSRKL